MKKISVIMSAYNESIDIFKNSIDSILNQTYKNIQLIVVVDNPNNIEIIDYLKSINDSRLEFYVNSENMGITMSLNKALSFCKGDFIARMDSDDISNLDRFETQITYLTDNNLDLCGSYVKWFSSSEDSIKVVKYPSIDTNVKKQLYHRNCIAHPTFFAKKNIYDELNGYNEIICCEDYDFLLRALKKNYKLGNVPTVLLNYRVNNNGISRKNLGKQILISNFVKKYYKHIDKNMLSTEELSIYLDSKSYKKKVKRYDSFYKKKEVINSKNNLVIKIYYSVLLLKELDILLVNIYETLYSKFILLFDLIGVHYENKKNNS